MDDEKAEMKDRRWMTTRSATTAEGEAAKGGICILKVSMSKSAINLKSLDELTVLTLPRNDGGLKVR